MSAWATTCIARIKVEDISSIRETIRSAARLALQQSKCGGCGQVCCGFYLQMVLTLSGGNGGGATMSLTLQDFINGISLGGMYSLLAVGFALIFGVLKFSNLAHGNSMMLCAYLSYFIAQLFHANIFMTIILTGIAGGCLGLVIERVGFRRLLRKNANGLLFFVSSFIIGMLIENVASVVFQFRYFAYPKFFEKAYIKVGSYTVSTPSIVMLMVSVVLLGIISYLLYGTRYGVAVRALAQDRNTTGLMGVNSSALIAITFFAAYFIGGVGGFFLGYKYGITTGLGNVMSKIMIASVIGGLGSISGAVIGSILLGMLEVILIKIPLIGDAYSPVVIFCLLIVLLIIRPRGIMGKFTTEKV